MYRVISSGSQGNAILYHDSILVDCGVPFVLIKPYIFQIQLVLLTHEHGDHFNIDTLWRLAHERPTLRIGCCKWMYDKISVLKNVDLYEVGQVYDYGKIKISPVKLYHDVPNCGYRIFRDNTRIFHATDTAHLEGISAKEYDLYAIEHNYNDETILESIAEKERQGKYAYQKASMNSHLSEQQARDFIYKNRAPHSRVLRLHESKLSY